MTVSGNTCLTCKVRNCSILKPCTVDTLSTISTFKTERKFNKAELIFEQGEPTKGVYFIKKGIVKVEKKAPHGRSIIVKICGPGDIFGHRGPNSLIYQNHSATALSDAYCCFVPVIFFKEILNNSPDLEKQLTEEYQNDLEKMEQKSLSLAYKSVREKVAEVILLLSELYCYGPKTKNFSIDLSRQDFADLSCTTKEQVSATLKEFSRNSLIQYSGKKFNFIDVEKLKSLSDRL